MRKHNMKKHSGSTRREFLSQAGIGLLAGYSFKSDMGLAQSIKTPDTDRYQSVTINTHEWYGDIEERLDFPKDWNVNVHHIAGYKSPVLSKEEIRNRIQNPINSKPLREIAAGKKTAVITFDDLSRATPSNEIAPVVVEELKAGGIKDENILFMAMVGSHRPLTQPEARAKLGDAIVDNYPWINHNPHDNLVDRGLTSHGNHVKLNFYFMQADIKVSMSGIKKHGAGYSGGAKAILPGVSWINTIEYMHEKIQWGGLGKIYHNDARADMEEAARKAGLDFSINTVMNEKRRPIGIHTGDVVEAFRSAAHDASQKYRTEMVGNADVVVANCYPMNIQETGFGFANQSLREGGTAIVIWQLPLVKASIHYWDERHYFTGKSFWENQRERDPVRKAGQIILFSQYVQRRDTLNFPEGRVKVIRKWEDVLALLEKSHGPGTSVAVYPWAGYQHGPVTLDSP